MSDNATPLILITRPRLQADRFAAMCRAEFGQVAEVMVAPLQEIADTGALPEITAETRLVFTSENGVLAFARGGQVKSQIAYCVGDRTAAVARAAGLNAFSANGTVEHLCALILAAPDAGPLLHVHGKHTRGDLVGKLRANGLHVTGHIAYEQRALPMTQQAKLVLTSPRRVIAPLFSPRSAELLADGVPNLCNTCLACISDATQLALPEHLRPLAIISDTPTGMAMLIAIARQLCP